MESPGHQCSVVLNGVLLNKYRCRRGSNSLEGLHAHLFNAIPSQRCGIMPFQVYLMAFPVQWNNRMASLRVAGGQGRQTSCMDARQIQRMNQQAEVLFGKDHVLEPNFAARRSSLVWSVPVHQFRCYRDYYVQKVEEEQSREEESEETAEQEQGEDEEMADEGLGMSSESEEDPMHSICRKHAVLTQEEQVEEEDSPALQDVLMNSDLHLVPVDLRQKIATAASCLHKHDNMNSQVHLDLHCTGGEKGQLNQIKSNQFYLYSPKSQSTFALEGFTICTGSDNNYRATVMPKVTPHLKVLSETLFPEAPALPTSLPPPDQTQVQYQHLHHKAGKRRGEKRRFYVEDPEPEPTPVDQSIRPKPTSSTYIQPKSAASTYEPPAVSAAPVLLVLPAQPQAPSIIFHGPCSKSFVPVAQPPAPTIKPYMPNKSLRPCGACHVHQCGRKRKRYTPSKDKAAGSIQKIVSYCPSTRKSTTSGFKDVVYDSFEHFKSVVDVQLEKRKNN